MILTVNGQKVEIVNWDEFASKLLNAIGFQAHNEIVKLIDRMGLVDTGNFRTSLTQEVDGNSLVLGSTAPYAPYLEYGTFNYFDRFGIESFPSTTDPKKKDLKPKQRENFPKGMQPFAVFRRTLWNPNKMTQIINKGVKAATR
jgi:hypothetical protein